MQRVSVMRGSKIVLSDFSLRIGDGEHVAILGPNGCGKSTLVKTIMRELYPLADDRFTMSIYGRSVWNIFDLRPLLGIVSNDLMALCTRDVTGYDLVLSGFFSSVEIMPWHIVTPTMRAKAAAVLGQLEIEHLAERTLDELSSGEARRVLIARALVHDPKALLLDEPTNSLDVSAQHELRDFMRRLAQQGTGVVLVTHHLADIIPEIERVIFMRNGALVGDGRKADMLTPPRLQELFGVPVDVAVREGYYHAW